MTPPDSSRPSTLLDRPDAPAATRPTARPRVLPEPPEGASSRVAGQVLVAVSWLVGAALVVLLARLLKGPSEALYLAVTARTAELPGSGLVAEGGVLVLLGLCAVVAWRSRRAGASAVATTLVAAVVLGVVGIARARRRP